MTRITEWVLGIVGAILAFMGLFILFAGGEQSIGLGGELTWQVSEISTSWGIGLFVGGAVLLAGTIGLLLWEQRHPHVYAEQSERNGLFTHIAVFVLVNGFLWLQDIVAGGGLEYAYWVTIPWGIGLTVHILSYTGSHRHMATPRPTG